MTGLDGGGFDADKKLHTPELITFHEVFLKKEFSSYCFFLNSFLLIGRQIAAAWWSLVFLIFLSDIKNLVSFHNCLFFFPPDGRLEADTQHSLQRAFQLLRGVKGLMGLLI